MIPISKTKRTYLLGHLATLKRVQDRLIKELALVALEVYETQSLINWSSPYRKEIETARSRTTEIKPATTSNEESSI
jgi:hypothetical protein